jgi:hypothetical protein
MLGKLCDTHAGPNPGQYGVPTTTHHVADALQPARRTLRLRLASIRFSPAACSFADCLGLVVEHRNHGVAAVG